MCVCMGVGVCGYDCVYVYVGLYYIFMYKVCVGRVYVMSTYPRIHLFTYIYIYTFLSIAK